MTPRIRVLMVTSDWLWNSWGGPAVFIARQAEFLRREGIEVDLFPFRGARHPGNYVAAWKEVRRRVRQGGYDLVHAQFGQSGLTDPGERSANKSCVSPARCASPVAPLSQQRSNVESWGSGRPRCSR